MTQFKFDKSLLHEAIVKQLESAHQVALKAAEQAYETATNSETKAENKYDTFGLEASYLAHGQSKRVDQSLNDIKVFKKLMINAFTEHSAIGLGALVGVSNDDEIQKNYFISPVAGGLKIKFNDDDIMLITPSAPLGEMLIGKYYGDEFELKSLEAQLFHITSLN